MGLRYPVVREPPVKVLSAILLPVAVHPRRHPLADDASMLGAGREGRHEVVGVIPQYLERLVQAQSAVSARALATPPN